MNDFRRRFIFLLLSIFSLLIPANSVDTINSSQIIRDGETLVSSGGVFELGFFSPGNSSNRYVGIWYKDISVRTYVWVANREAPLTTKSGVIRVIQPGSFVLLDKTINGSIVWSTNATGSVRNPAAQLLDSGNLVVKADVNDDRPQNFMWQSFDYPTDTLLPGIGIGWNYVAGAETYLSSWRTEDDPAPGEYSYHLNPTGSYPQMIVKKGNVVQQRIGPWNGLEWSGESDTIVNSSIYRNILLVDKNEVKYMEETYSSTIILRSRLSPSGGNQRWLWNHQTNTWVLYTSFPRDICDNYGVCGAYGSCSTANTPICACIDGFVPRDQESWNRADWSGGCIRMTALNCRGDVFLNYTGIKLPDSTNSSFNDQVLLMEECEAQCKRNCSCVAYTQLNISESGSGCLFYHGDLIDIKALSSGGQDLYIRMASAEREQVAHSKREKTVILIVSITSVVGTVLLLCLSLILVFAKKRKRITGPFSGSHGKEAEVPLLGLSTILKATDHFSITNKLGEGGFGPVYKGMLEDGQEIAVKRLSKTSKQGVDELKNEVILIAKLQHRNLVRLLGCCIQGEENMLIYEYMPNNSLDLILFDKTRRTVLDWEKRYNIINGIAKGLLYLHQDSRLRIIHRDLKASNILLDADMNPKISDFGLARSFGGNETEANTHRVVGTYGYMSPEYVMKGLFSIKSDVFSFGVLVLEAVSGKRNRDFSFKDKNLKLTGHAWTLYKEGSLRELVDASLDDSFDIFQTLRSIHVGLLCVQARPEDRPSMSSVVFMLGNKDELPEPKQPAFFTERDVSASENFTLKNPACSANEVTITLLDGR